MIAEELKPAQKQKPAQKRAVVLTDARFGLAEHKRNDWVATAEQGTTIEDVLKPEYWSYVSGRFAPYDHIEVRVDDGEWLLELLVTACGRNFAKVAVLGQHSLVKASNIKLPDSGYEVLWKGPHLKFCVIRKSDSEKIREGYATKEEGLTWVREFEKAQ